MTAMAKDPDDRYQSAAELRDDLTRFTKGSPSPPGRRHWGRRQPGR